MATSLEIINGLSQVLSNKYDGALNEDGEPLNIGLKREGEKGDDGKPAFKNMARVMDGFGACVYGDRLHIKYHCEPKLKEVHRNSFESDMESMVEKVKSFIQKEFKKVAGTSLSLSEPSEIDVLVEYISRIRTSVKAHRCWKISGLDDIKQEHKDDVADATRKWIETSKAAKKAKNDTRKS